MADADPASAHEQAAAPKKTPPPCGQCGKPAVIGVSGVPLCVDHHYKFEVARTLAFRMAAIGANYAVDEMDHITGLNFPGVRSPRIQVPDIPRGPPILNNIHINDSVVGTVNTGTVQSIDVSVTYLEKSGNTQIGDALKQFTEAVANDQSLETARRNELLDQIEYLSRAAADAAKERKPGMIRAVLEGLTTAANAAPTIANAWGLVKPLLETHFGVSLPG